MDVPFIELRRVAALVGNSMTQRWERVISDAEFVGGASVAALEKRLAESLGTRHAIACSNGSDALVIALQALGVGSGHKVALPNLTFWATYEAIAQRGAIPVLVDIDAADLQMDLDELRRAHDRFGLDAVVLVHLMGWASARLAEFREFCQAEGLPLLEDGAQAWGAETRGESVFAGARVGTLSFYPAKVLGGCMDGGAILTNDGELARLLRKLCNHGRTTHYSYSHVGWNSRMGGLQAAWLQAALDHAGAIVRQRRTLEASYRALFAELSDVVTGHGAPEGVRGNGYLSVCTLKQHDPADVGVRLSKAGIGTGRVYPETLDMQPPAAAALRMGALVRSRAFSARVLNLPLFFGMTEEEMANVQAAVRRVFRQAAR